MIDLTEPRDFIQMIEDEEECFFTRLSPYFIKGFSLPVETYIYDNGKCNGYIFSDTPKGRKFQELFTDIPSMMIVIEDILYYVSIDKNPVVFAGIPKGYESDVKVVLDFISEYHDILLLFWNRKLNFLNLYEFLRTRVVITVCRNQNEFNECHTDYNNITRKLRKLKKAGKYHGNI
ncbi:MAG: hypothetical protein K2J39_11570 [Ruminococcus sp.]|nr:hypothetical protein [Ruminococcus sp.]